MQINERLLIGITLFKYRGPTHNYSTSLLQDQFQGLEGPACGNYVIYHDHLFTPQQFSVGAIQQAAGLQR